MWNKERGMAVKGGAVSPSLSAVSFRQPLHVEKRRARIVM